MPGITGGCLPTSMSAKCVKQNMVSEYWDTCLSIAYLKDNPDEQPAVEAVDALMGSAQSPAQDLSMINWQAGFAIILSTYLIIPVVLCIFTGVCASKVFSKRPTLDAGLVGLGIGILGFAANFASFVVIAQFDTEYLQLGGIRIHVIFAAPIVVAVLASTVTVWRCLRSPNIKGTPYS